MLLRILFAVLLVLAPARGHVSTVQSSAVTAGAQESDLSGALASNRYLLSAEDGDAERAAKRPSKKKPTKKKPSKKPSKKKPSPAPSRRPSPPVKPVAKPSPPKRSPSPAIAPVVIPSPPPSPLPSPPPPPACPLSIAGQQINFQACDSTSWSDVGTLYATLQGETLTLGFKGAVSTQGWVGIDLTPAGKMPGSDAFVARTNVTDGTINAMVVRINGYNPGTFVPTTVYSGVVVAKEGGVLVGTAKTTWPAGASTLSLTLTAGNMNPTTLNVGKHYKTPVIKTLNRATLTVS